MYTITYAQGVSADIKRLRPDRRGLLLDAIELQLRHEPTRPARNRKVIVGLVPPWGHMSAVWELRVGEYRVFYDVDEEESTVMIRAIRHKPPHRSTEEIL